MDGKFNNHPFGNNNDDDHSPENRAAAVAGSKRSSKGRGIKKRVVTVAMKDMVQAGSRLKGETPLPFDSWAWRKYGQKPIKGSPYPRGYYRCSSSKGCPARKQVERNHLDSTKLLITYSSEHNHSAPPTTNRNHHHHHHTTTSAAASPPPVTTTTTDAAFVGDVGEEFRWFSDLEGTPSSSAVLESPTMLSLDHGDLDMAGMLFPDEDSLFSDLGELPECAVVFRRCHMAPWWCAGSGKQAG